MNRRTSFITAAAVTGVILAGTSAVAANVGILTAAGSDNVGELSAAVPITTVVEPQIIDVYVEEPAPATTALSTTVPPITAPAPQEFAVDSAGIVRIDQTESGIVLNSVDAAEGWTWTTEQVAPTELTVNFTSADSEFVFYASLAADGTIAARVDQPIVKYVQAPAAPSSGSSSGSSAGSSSQQSAQPAPKANDDDHDDDGGHDDDHDSDDHRSDDHEGGDDDD